MSSAEPRPESASATGGAVLPRPRGRAPRRCWGWILRAGRLTMTVRLKLVIIVLFVGLVPLGVSAWTTISIHHRAFDETLRELHRRTAAEEATRMEARIEGVARSIQVLASQTIRWSELSSAEREAATWLVYRQAPEVVAVALVGTEGKALGRPAFVEAPAVGEEAGHPAGSPELLAHLTRVASGPGTAPGHPLHPPLVPSGAMGAVLPMVLPIDSGAENEPWRLVVGLSAGAFCRPAADTGELEVLVLDGQGRLLCPRLGHELLEPVGASLGPDWGPGGDTVYRDGRGRELLAASAVLSPGIRVIAQQPRATAFAASRQILIRALFWVVLGLMVALGAGWYLSRGITEPLSRLATAAQELASGNLEHRVQMSERDELGELGRAFDRMADELAVRDAEIRAFNEQLQARVDARTRELVETQERLVYSEKTAVMASISGGVATEINEPLTSVLGIVQLLYGRARPDPNRAREAELLANAEQEALRIRDLTQRVQSLSQRQPASQFRLLHLNDVTEASIQLLLGDAQAKEIRFVRSYSETLPQALGNFTQLQQALVQVLTNAVQATPRGGEVVVATQVRDPGWLEIRIQDQGRGIPDADLDRIFDPFFTTREPGEGMGLGLTIARRIIEEHGGSVRPGNTREHAATFRILLPVGHGPPAPVGEELHA